MEISLVGRNASVAEPELAPIRPTALRRSWRAGLRPSRVRLEPSKRSKGAVVRVGPKTQLVAEEKQSTRTASKPMTAPLRLFVGLPLDSVTGCNTLNHARAISAGLRALALLGVDGVELPVFWGIVQPDTTECFDWSSLLTLAYMVRDAGLHLRISLNLHACQSPSLPLPKWVTRTTEADPDLFFTDRTGRRCPNCLSFAVDELPVLGGRTPLQAYEQFFESARSAFSDLFVSTITDIVIGLGPNGELRYPSSGLAAGNQGFIGAGEFQCYDKYMLANLKKHAEASGNPLWGLGGPHDAPKYNQSPDSGHFFKEHGGSWESAYGDFFLSWYSSQLVAHGDRLLSIASKIFSDAPVKISAKVPLLHTWHKMRSRPAQLTAGFYNTDDRDGYDAVAKVFARNGCTMVIPGMGLTDAEQPLGLQSSPESLLDQIIRACNKHGVQVAGENSSLTGAASGFSKIKEILLTKHHMKADSFTYQRMGAQFFSPEHFPLFTEFVRSLSQPEHDADDLVSNEEPAIHLPVGSLQETDCEMQAV